MSTVPISLSNLLPSSILKLDSTGVNWAIFTVRFQDAMEAKGFWGHFDGSTPCLVPKDAKAVTAKEAAFIEQWDNHDCSAKSLLTQTIPDSMLMCIHSK
jgi:hypothetical protein